MPRIGRNNLPAQFTTFVGRKDELAQLGELITKSRLVTLTATAGAGKTRLAVELGARALNAFPDGTWFVDLVPVRSEQLVAKQFASALRVRERPRQDLSQTLIESLSESRALLVVDNCEHVIDACASMVAAILRSCTGVNILATSREPLRIEGEVVWRVPSLATPGPNLRIDLREAAECEAIRLFLDRAQSVASDLHLTSENLGSIVNVCSSLDGLPLAIELAAARAGSLRVDQILSRLQDRFGLLTSGSRSAPPKHRTLQAAIDWSHDLCTDRERLVFRRLSVFAGTTSLEAIEDVCWDRDLELSAIAASLGSLVDKSLVIAEREAGTPVRFRMLETLNHYAMDQLIKHHEVATFRNRHARFFLSFAETAFDKLRGPELQAWHASVGRELSNLRLALDGLPPGRTPATCA